MKEKMFLGRGKKCRVDKMAWMEHTKDDLKTNRKLPMPRPVLCPPALVGIASLVLFLILSVLARSWSRPKRVVKKYVQYIVVIVKTR